MAGIFINYRSDDAVFAADLIDERIRGVFGGDNVFLDCRDLHAGLRFEPELWRRLESSTVLLVLVGERWLTLTDEAGRRRIDDPDDFVRAEIRVALERGMYVVPVLLQATTLPRTDDLPADIAPLNRHQYVHLRVRQAAVDLDHLVGEVRRLVPADVLPEPSRTSAGFQQTFTGPVGNVVNGDVHATTIVGNNFTDPKDV